MRFEDKVVIVTGSSRGIGKAIAIAFAKEGADLVLTARSVTESVDRFRLPGTITATAEEVRALGRRALAAKADVSVPGEVDRMARKAVQEFGRIDILVNCAAFTNVTPTLFHEMTPEECDAQIGTTFKGVLNCCRAIVPQMIKQGGGRIINITTAGAKIPSPFLSIYTSCKAAVAHFSRCLAREVSGHGILVNCVAPGVVRTDALVPIFTQEGLDQMIATQPIARCGEPEELAHAVLFLASDQASYVTGQHLCVDGGISPY